MTIDIFEDFDTDIEIVTKEDRKQSAIENCGSFLTYTDIGSLEPRITSFRCKNFHECQRCFDWRVQETTDKITELFRYKRNLYYGFITAEEERSFKRKIRKEEYLRFPLGHTTVFVTAYPINDFQPININHVYELAYGWMNTPKGSRPSFGLYNDTVPSKTRNGAKVKTRTFTIEQDSIKKFNDSAKFVGQFVKNTVFHAIPQGASVPPEYVADLVNEAMEEAMRKRGINFKRGLNYTQTIEDDSFLSEALSKHQVTLQLVSIYSFRSTYIELNRHLGADEIDSLASVGLCLDPKTVLYASKANEKD